MNLILLEPSEVHADGRAVLSGARARHVREVLRVSDGGSIRVGIVDGSLGVATVEMRGEEVFLQCVFSGDIPPRPRVDLLLAMPRPKVMKRLWPVLASLGVGHIFISNAWKTERNYFDTHVLESDVIRAGLIEGLQQARDTRLPGVTVHRQFRKWLEDELPAHEKYEARWVAAPGESRFPREKLSGISPAGRVLLAIGPEGGWTPFEMELFATHGFKTVSWGARTLRTDTACTVLLGLMAAELS